MPPPYSAGAWTPAETYASFGCDRPASSRHTDTCCFALPVNGCVFGNKVLTFRRKAKGLFENSHALIVLVIVPDSNPNIRRDALGDKLLSDTLKSLARRCTCEPPHRKTYVIRPACGNFRQTVDKAVATVWQKCSGGKKTNTINQISRYTWSWNRVENVV